MIKQEIGIESFAQKEIKLSYKQFKLFKLLVHLALCSVRYRTDQTTILLNDVCYVAT